MSDKVLKNRVKKTLLKGPGIWLNIYSDTSDEWIAYFVRGANKEGTRALSGHAFGRSRKELIRNIRVALTANINPKFNKVKGRFE